ncbi:MAG: hypothetical protein ACLFO2_05090 [Candidatus Woesearchaeota archaeon]
MVDADRFRWQMGQAYTAIRRFVSEVEERLERRGDLERVVDDANRGVADGRTAGVLAARNVVNAYLERCVLKPSEGDEADRLVRKYLQVPLPEVEWYGESYRRMAEQLDSLFRGLDVSEQPDWSLIATVRKERLESFLREQRDRMVVYRSKLEFLEKSYDLIRDTPFLNRLYHLPFDGS